jgi:serine/threonine protein kinase
MTSTTTTPDLIFGKYALIRRLALGGMGEVFLAQQTGGVAGTERLAILKSLLPELAAQDGFIDQFLDEARVAAKLNHPHIVQMFEAGLWNGMHFIAMEYIRGENLSRLQKVARSRQIPLPIHLGVRIVRDALLGLAHAHSAVDEMTGQPLQVVHRDVSPQNIMVRIDGVTKLVDFGIAKAANKLDRTKTGVLKGKLQFMSPEQVMGDEVDARTDQFAMGVVLWELLTGKRLFQGENEIQILRAVSQQPILAPSSVVPGLPVDLEVVVMRMLERDKHRRYADCGEAADELTAWLNQGSRRVSEGDVAAFVKDIVGSSIDEATRAAVSGENFVLNLQLTPSRPATLSPTGPLSETSPTMVRREAQVRRRRGLGAIGVGVAAAVAMAVGVFVVLREDPASTTATTTAATTTTAGTTAPPPLLVAAAPARRGADGTTEITLGEPAGARIIVDSVERPERTPTVLVLSAGPHTIELVSVDGRRGVVTPAFAKPVVVVTSVPPGASLAAGGVSFGITPARLDGKLESGLTHRLTVSLRGYIPRELVVENLQDGEVRELTVKLDKPGGRTPTEAPGAPLPSPPPPAVAGVARLTVNIVPAAKVFLDGDLVGTTPLVLPRTPAGRHSLTLERTDGTMKKTVAVTLKDGEDKKLPLTWD